MSEAGGYNLGHPTQLEHCAGTPARHASALLQQVSVTISTSESPSWTSTQRRSVVPGASPPRRVFRGRDGDNDVHDVWYTTQMPTVTCSVSVLTRGQMSAYPGQGLIFRRAAVPCSSPVRAHAVPCSVRGSLLNATPYATPHATPHATHPTRHS